MGVLNLFPRGKLIYDSEKLTSTELFTKGSVRYDDIIDMRFKKANLVTNGNIKIKTKDKPFIFYNFSIKRNDEAKKAYEEIQYFFKENKRKKQIKESPAPKTRHRTKTMNDDNKRKTEFRNQLKKEYKELDDIRSKRKDMEDKIAKENERKLDLLRKEEEKLREELRKEKNRQEEEFQRLKDSEFNKKLENIRNMGSLNINEADVDSLKQIPNMSMQKIERLLELRLCGIYIESVEDFKAKLKFNKREYDDLGYIKNYLIFENPEEIGEMKDFNELTLTELVKIGIDEKTVADIIIDRDNNKTLESFDELSVEYDLSEEVIEKIKRISYIETSADKIDDESSIDVSVNDISYEKEEYNEVIIDDDIQDNKIESEDKDKHQIEENNFGRKIDF